jgi:hypothetical protein
MEKASTKRTRHSNWKLPFFFPSEVALLKIDDISFKTVSNGLRRCHMASDDVKGPRAGAFAVDVPHLVEHALEVPDPLLGVEERARHSGVL